MKNRYKSIILLTVFFNLFALGSQRNTSLNFLLCKIFCCQQITTDSYFFWHWKKENSFFKAATPQHQEIFNAIKNGQLKTVQNIFKNNRIEKHPGAPFAHAAAYYNKEKILLYFIKKGIKKNEPGLVKFKVNSGPGPFSREWLETKKYPLNKFAIDLRCDDKIKNIL